jgi:hypothetical protein
VRGFLEARDPETGELQWRWWSEPEKPGDPGSETWPNKGAHCCPAKLLRSGVTIFKSGGYAG